MIETLLLFLATGPDRQPAYEAAQARRLPQAVAIVARRAVGRAQWAQAARSTLQVLAGAGGLAAMTLGAWLLLAVTASMVP